MGLTMHLSEWIYPFLLPVGTKYHGHPSINKSHKKHRWMNTSSFGILTRGDFENFKGSTQERDIHHCKSWRASVLDSPKRTPNVRFQFAFLPPPFACERSWDVRGFVHRKKQLMEMQGNEECNLGPPSATWMSRWKLGSMVRINGLFHLLIKGVYWGYNPLPDHLLTSNGTSKYDWLVLTTLTTKCCSTLCLDHLGFSKTRSSRLLPWKLITKSTAQTSWPAHHTPMDYIWVIIYSCFVGGQLKTLEPTWATKGSFHSTGCFIGIPIKGYNKP